MTRTQKETAVKELRVRFSQAIAAIVTDYHGLDVDTVQKLRNQCREKNITHVVSKNTLTRLAVEGTSFEGLKDSLTGPNSISLVYDDAVVLAKTIKDFSKENENLEIKFGFLAKSGRKLEKADVDMLAETPPREVLLTRLVCALSAPYRGLAVSLNEILGKFVRTLEAVRLEKEKKS